MVKRVHGSHSGEQTTHVSPVAVADCGEGAPRSHVGRSQVVIARTERKIDGTRLLP
jgi:hypothetical protein